MPSLSDVFNFLSSKKPSVAPRDVIVMKAPSGAGEEIMEEPTAASNKKRGPSDAKPPQPFSPPHLRSRKPPLPPSPTGPCPLPVAAAVRKGPPLPPLAPHLSSARNDRPTPSISRGGSTAAKADVAEGQLLRESKVSSRGGSAAAAAKSELTVEQLLKESKIVKALPIDGNVCIRLMAVSEKDLLQLEPRRQLRPKGPTTAAEHRQHEPLDITCPAFRVLPPERTLSAEELARRSERLVELYDSDDEIKVDEKRCREGKRRKKEKRLRVDGGLSRKRTLRGASEEGEGGAERKKARKEELEEQAQGVGESTGKRKVGRPRKVDRRVKFDVSSNRGVKHKRGRQEAVSRSGVPPSKYYNVRGPTGKFTRVEVEESSTSSGKEQAKEKEEEKKPLERRQTRSTAGTEQQKM